MPNFDGKGPLKRGRVIGRGLGSCSQSAWKCSRKDADEQEPRHDDELPVQ
jgi:hypothetical protein